MKLSIPSLLVAILLVPTNLIGQIAPSSQRISLMRCEDMEIIDVDHSFGFQNLESNMAYVTSDGKTFVVSTAEESGASRIFTYNYYQSATGQIIKTEPGKFASEFISTDEGLLSYGRDIEVLDSCTLEQRWHKNLFRDNPFYVYNGTLLAEGVGLGRFYGYDLATGKEKWRVKISHEGGVSDVFPMDDEHVLIVADDLVKLNTQTGERKAFEINNYVRNGKMMAGQILAGVAIGVAAGVVVANMGTGVYYIPIPWYNNPRIGALRRIYGDPSTISCLSSNIVNEGNLYYLADRDGVRCFDSDLNVQWTTPFPAKQGSSSYLRQSGDTLWLVNYGYANFRGAEQDNTGIPFVACYNARTGEQLLFKRIGKKQAPVKQVKCYSDRAVFIFTDSCKTLYFDAPKQVKTLVSKNFKNRRLLDGDLYRLDPETHQFLPFDENEPYLQDKEWNIYRMTSDGEEEVAPRSSVYRPQGLFADSLIVVQGGLNGADCWLLNKQGVPVYHIMQSIENSFVEGDNLFLFTAAGFTIVNKDILKQE